MNQSQWHIKDISPSPFLWTKIEARIAARNHDKFNPIWAWSLSAVVTGLLLWSCLFSPEQTTSGNEAMNSINVLYHE
jgi:hypothetical protein